MPRTLPFSFPDIPVDRFMAPQKTLVDSYDKVMSSTDLFDGLTAGALAGIIWPFIPVLSMNGETEIKPLHELKISTLSIFAANVYVLTFMMIGIVLGLTVVMELRLICSSLLHVAGRFTPRISLGLRNITASTLGQSYIDVIRKLMVPVTIMAIEETISRCFSTLFPSISLGLIVLNPEEADAQIFNLLKHGPLFFYLGVSIGMSLIIMKELPMIVNQMPDINFAGVRIYVSKKASQLVSLAIYSVVLSGITICCALTIIACFLVPEPRSSSDSDLYSELVCFTQIGNKCYFGIVKRRLKVMALILIIDFIARRTFALFKTTPFGSRLLADWIRRGAVDEIKSAAEKLAEILKEQNAGLVISGCGDLEVEFVEQLPGKINSLSFVGSRKRKFHDSFGNGKATERRTRLGFVALGDKLQLCTDQH